MQVIVNGKKLNLPAGTTLRQLIDEQKVNPAAIAVELNRAVIPKAKFSQVVLKENDRVEIISFVGGG